MRVSEKKIVCNSLIIEKKIPSLKRQMKEEDKRTREMSLASGRKQHPIRILGQCMNCQMMLGQEG